MRTFDSRHYKVLGFNKVTVGGREVECWLLQTVDSKHRSDYVSQTIMVQEAKFVDRGYVYYLHRTGHVENKARQACVLPAREA